MATLGIASIVAQKMKQTFANKFFEMYNISLMESEFSAETVMQYLNGPANVYKMVHEIEDIVVETAPPYEMTPAPNLKWVAPMDLCRNYVQNFFPTNPYDEGFDEFITTDKKKDFERECGAVVYAMRSHTKQLHFLYACVASFVKILKGEVLVVGDNGGAVAYRTNFEHTYTMYRGQPDWELLQDIPDKRKGCIIYNEQFENLFHTRKFDHIVVFLYSYDFIFPKDAVVHYLNIIPGNGGIIKIRGNNEFNINGKVVTLHPNPVGSLICHTSYFPVHDPLDNFVSWYTDLFPASSCLTASLSPLTNYNKLGRITNVLVSDKVDGELCYFEVKNKQMRVYDSKSRILFEGVDSLPDQKIILERVDDTYFVVEPLYYFGKAKFGDWLELHDYMLNVQFDGQCFKFEHKIWHPFPLDLNWQQFAKSGEGVVIKSRDSLIGSKDYAFRKLQTYYIKVPSRVSYEDRVERFQSKDHKNWVYRGCHNIYSDPDLVFDGTGVYEIHVQRCALFRKRDKVHADPAWYVDAVTMILDFSKIFCVPLKLIEFADNANQGLGAMSHVKHHRVAVSQVMPSPHFNELHVNFPADVGSILSHLGKVYVVFESDISCSAGVLML